MLDPNKHPYITCRKCGWVSMAYTREQAQEDIDVFNAYYVSLSDEEKEAFGNRQASLFTYSCQLCGPGTRFRRSVEGDVPAGSTVGPALWTLTPEYLSHLLANDYEVVLPIPGFRWMALYEFLFTTAIIIGDLDDYEGYSDRWCYKTKEDAVAGMVEWIGRNWEGEPAGWVRHPSSGRRGGPDHEFNEAMKEL